MAYVLLLKCLSDRVCLTHEVQYVSLQLLSTSILIGQTFIFAYVCRQIVASFVKVIQVMKM